MELNSELIEFARNCAISYYKLNNVFKILDFDDLVSDSYYCLVLCSKTYNESIGNFKGYFSQRLWWFLLNSCKEKKMHNDCESELVDAGIKDTRIHSEEDIINNIIKNDLFDDPSLTVEQIDILLRLSNGESQKEIAEVYGVNHKAISFQLRKTKDKLNYCWKWDNGPVRIRNSVKNTKISRMNKKLCE